MRSVSSRESPALRPEPATAPPAESARIAPRRRARRPHVCKLVLCARADRQVMEAVGGYPGRLQSCVLSHWLRSGWRLTRTRELSEPMPPGLPLAPAPAARITRRVRFDDPADPTLAGFLCSLPRKERGREIRNFIAVALRSRA